jgi:hypothetical protein
MLRNTFCNSCLFSVAIFLVLGGFLGEPVPSVSEQIFWQHVRDDQLLDQPVGLTVTDRPLTEVLRKLADQCRVPILVHPEDLVGQQAVTIDVSRVRLRSLLSLLLEPHQLDFVLDERQIIVGSAARLDARSPPWIARTYLLPGAPATFRGMDLEDWWELIDGVVVPAPAHLFVPGDPGPEHAFGPSALVVVDQPHVHRQVMHLLAGLESHRDSAVPMAAIKLTGRAPSCLEQRLHHVLQQPCQVELFRADLPVALDYLSREYDVPIVISPQLQRAPALTRPAAVTITAQHGPLAAVLDTILRPLDWTFRVDRDVIEIIPVSSDDHFEHWLVPVDDLVRDTTDANLDKLANLLQYFTISLRGDGRVSSSTIWPLGDRTLWIKATPEIHNRIQRLLSDLRACLLSVATPIPLREQAMHDVLTQPSHLEFLHADLEDVAVWIEKQYGLPIDIDTRLLGSVRPQITCDLRDLRLGDALRRMLRTVDLELVVWGDRALVTDLRRASEFLETHCFDIRPLIDADWGVMTGRTLISFLLELREAEPWEHAIDVFDGVLIVCALPSRLQDVDETLDRLMKRLERLPVEREFSAAYRGKRTETTAMPTVSEIQSLKRAYAQVLRAAIETQAPE